MGLDVSASNAQGDHFTFRAGSYSGYNLWRDRLAKAAGYTSAEAVWKDPKPGPFLEIINFSDCEGIFDAATCAKLAKDFAEHAHILNADEEFVRNYKNFYKAFCIGAFVGRVEFC